MAKLIVFRGLPGSGKTTKAKQLIRTYGNTKRVNKDDLRAMVDDSIWTKFNEKLIVDTRDSLTKLYLTQGCNVIIDDTNLEEKHIETMRSIAKSIPGATFEVDDSFLSVPVSVCIERDSKRPKPVGRDVIIRMAKKYVQYRDAKVDRVPESDKEWAVVCDLDGTVAFHVDRSPYEFHKCYMDEPIFYVVETVKALVAKLNARLIFVSGREDSCYNKTFNWLKDKAEFQDEFDLFMRKTDDRRPDNIVKGEIMKEIIQKHSIFAVFDDRASVVAEWNKMGLPVFDCSNGKGQF